MNLHHQKSKPKISTKTSILIWSVSRKNYPILQQLKKHSCKPWSNNARKSPVTSHNIQLINPISFRWLTQLLSSEISMDNFSICSKYCRSLTFLNLIYLPRISKRSSSLEIMSIEDMSPLRSSHCWLLLRLSTLNISFFLGETTSPDAWQSSTTSGKNA